MASKMQNKASSTASYDSGSYDSQYTIHYKGKPITGTVIPNRVFVGSIPPSATEEELRQLFGKYGTIISSKVIMDRFGSSKGYGFVTFESEDSVRRLQQDTNNLVLRDRRLNIAPAIQKIPPYGLDTSSQLPQSVGVGASSSAGTAAAASVYMSNGVQYTYHNGMAFFSPSPSYPTAHQQQPQQQTQQQQPLSVYPQQHSQLLPAAAAQEQSYYPLLYGPPMQALNSPYQPQAVLCTLPNGALSVLVNNVIYPYQSLAAATPAPSTSVPNHSPSADYMYTSIVPTLHTQLPPMYTNPPQQKVTSAPTVSLPDTQQQLLDTPPPIPQFPVDITAPPPALPHIVDGQQFVQMAQQNAANYYYDMTQEMYQYQQVPACSVAPTATVPPPLQGYDMSDATNPSNVSSEDSSNYESQTSSVFSSQETVKSALTSPPVGKQPQTMMNRECPYDATANAAAITNAEKQELKCVPSSLPVIPSVPTDQYPSMDPNATLIPYIDATGMMSSDYNAALLNSNPQMMYPFAETGQGYYINSANYSSLGMTYMYPRNGNMPYANDRPPKSDRNRRYSTPREATPPIPEFPFHGGVRGVSYRNGYKPRNGNNNNNNGYTQNRNATNGAEAGEGTRSQESGSKDSANYQGRSRVFHNSHQSDRDSQYGSYRRSNNYRYLQDVPRQPLLGDIGQSSLAEHGVYSTLSQAPQYPFQAQQQYVLPQRQYNQYLNVYNSGYNSLHYRSNSQKRSDPSKKYNTQHTAGRGRSRYNRYQEDETETSDETSDVTLAPQSAEPEGEEEKLEQIEENRNCIETAQNDGVQEISNQIENLQVQQ